MTELTVVYTFCDTVESAMDAVALLSSSRYLILDCEGRDIGHKDGALSLICIGTEGAKHIFLFDAVKLPPHHPAMESLMRLLGDARIRKIVWDGRQDFLEIWENYGTALDGVLDLQIAEVVSRSAYRGERDQHRKSRLVRSQFNRKDVLPLVKQFPDIHLLIGMQTCLDDHKLGTGVKKDTEVVAMHQAGGSGLWMERPLSTKLLQYAANDIFLIFRLYDYFLNRRWIREANIPDLLAQCKRYVSIHQKQGRMEKSNYFRRGPLLPMDILSVGPLAREHCTGCGRQLSNAAYEMRTRRVKRRASVLKRRTRCRICYVMAIRRKMPPDERWVEV